jgi:ubiquinone/menaquinone biosynthesis C-methylase UbiE
MAARADYGLDAPRIVKKFFWRGITFLLFGFGLYSMNQADAGAAAAAGRLFGILGSIGAAFLLTSIVMYVSSRLVKPKLRDQLLDKISWRGDERVLDVGCGRGLMLIGAAKRLKTGRATGADIWSQEDLKENTPEALKANAQAEGVAERIKVDNADARKLPYPDGHFDVVLSSLAIHNIKEVAEREKALAEMWRVLKAGGTMVIYDIFHVSDYVKFLAAKGAAILEQSGTMFYWMVPSKWVVVKKTG